MSAVAIEALLPLLAPRTRLAGLDLGTKTIGIALSDLGLRIATPFHTIRRTKFSKDAEELLALCAREKVGALVLGLPLNMNGTEGPRAQATRAFLRNLAPLTELPVVLWDERLSTAAAERAMLEADLSRSKRAAKIDAAAAAFILQGALDRLRGLPSHLSSAEASAKADAGEGQGGGKDASRGR
jgi:putative Holliday junction resolvase